MYIWKSSSIVLQGVSPVTWCSLNRTNPVALINASAPPTMNMFKCLQHTYTHQLLTKVIVKFRPPVFLACSGCSAAATGLAMSVGDKKSNQHIYGHQQVGRDLVASLF